MFKSEWLVEDRTESALWQLSEATFAWANTLIRQADRVLDYGCGSGAGTARFKGQATGVDVAEEQLVYARQHYPNVDFQQITETGIPFPDDTFDVVCSFQVIEHVDPNPYLAEAARVLKPAGKLLVVTPPREQRLYTWQRPWNPYHITEYSRPQLEETVGRWFGHVEYLPMNATDQIADVELGRWRRNRIFSIPFTIPAYPDGWRTGILRFLSGKVSTGGFSGNPAGSVTVGGPGELVNHCIIASR